MKAYPIYLAGMLTVILVALLPVVALPAGLHAMLGVVALIVAVILLVALILQRQASGNQRSAPVVETETAAAEVERPAAPVSGVSSEVIGSADAEVIAFLGMMQEKGRLVDFLMDDIKGYADEEVGQAARVVYDGCRAVLLEHLTIAPLHDGEEGAKVTVPEGYRTTDFQLSGKLSGPAPFEGTLLHRGWKVSKAKLPKVVVGKGELPNLAPAQVEV